MSAYNQKIVSINTAGKERSPGLRIVNESIDQLCDSLCDWLGGLRAPISEELFLLADGTRERLVQTRYLDLRRDVERDWTNFIEAFRRHFTDVRPSAGGADLDVPDFEGLQLVDDGVLSERIVLREFSAQLAETCDEELYGLDRRVASLLGYENPEEGVNPLAPMSICQALADACGAFECGAESRILLLRRIERHMHLALPALYREINTELIERGILPDLKRNYSRAATTRTSSQGAAASSSANTPRNPPLTDLPQASISAESGVALPQGIFAVMQRMMAARTSNGQGMPPMPTIGHHGADGSDPNAATISQSFLQSLNALQHVEWQPSSSIAVNQIRQVRDSDAAQQIGPLEAVTIDIVAMLFDFIFNDEELPATVKSLVGQLQIPVLKVAMLDHSFFASRQHPARRFLDSITGVALHWGAGAGESDPFLQRLELLVARIQQEFETNVEIFSEAIADLENFVTEHEAEEAATVEIVADATLRREAEEAAAERVQTALRPLLAKAQADVVRAFIAEPWAAVLRLKALVADAESTVWLDTLEVAEQLIWSVEPKADPDERLRLISALPMLLARLNAGLSLIEIDANTRNAFFDALVELHAAAMKGTPSTAPQSPPVETPTQAPTGDGDLLVTRRTEDGVVIEDVMLVGAAPMRRARDRAALDQVRELKRGDWVDFIDAEGNVGRERLNWVSPQKGILVFSNHRAAKAISISPEALARQIRDGAARIVETCSVFDKAIDGVMHSLNAA